MERLCQDFGKESVNMFLVDFPYTFKGKNRVTANKWDLPVDIERFFELASQLLTDDGCIALTATNPFSAYVVNKIIEMDGDKKYKDIDLVNFKYEWIWEKDNGSNFVHVKHQPFKVHEQVLIFGKAPTTYNKKQRYMKYNPQFTYDKPYKVTSGLQVSDNLATARQIGGIETNNKDGRRYPRSVQKFNLERGLHPTQKPTTLFEYLIETYTDEGDTVVDCCVGSGTTAVSAINTNRKYIVNDIEEKYVEITNKRIRELRGDI